MKIGGGGMVGLILQPTGFTGTNVYDPAHTSVSITLSGGNLTTSLTENTNNRNAMADNTTTGKVYWEFNIVSGNAADIGPASGHAAFGIVASPFSMAPDTEQPGTGNSSVGWYSPGLLYFNGVFTSSMPSYTIGDTGSIAVDFPNAKIWVRTNGGNWNNDVIANQNPATNTGGLSFAGFVGSSAQAAACFFIPSGVALVTTTNFGGSAFAYTAPAGFGNW